jgi:hypothetical protein
MTASAPVATPTPACLNCGSPLAGSFCSSCGQKAASTRLTVHAFVHDAIHEFLHLDGKIFRTMKVLVAKPGMLTREFLDGRRARYISPIRLYLTWSLLFFAGLALTPGAEDMVKVRPSRPPAGVRAMSPEEEQRRAEEAGAGVVHALPRAMFVLMPVFGLLTWAFYRKREPYYIAHLYYSIHFHALVFLLLTAVLLLGLAGSAGRAIGATLFLAVIPLHFISLRRVFGAPRKETIAKGIAIGVIYWITLALAMIALAGLVILDM